MTKLQIKAFLVLLIHEQKISDSSVNEIKDMLTVLQSVVSELLAATEIDRYKHGIFGGRLQGLQQIRQDYRSLFETFNERSN